MQLLYTKHICLKYRVTGSCGYPTHVVLVASDLHVALYSPRCSPTVTTSFIKSLCVIHNTNSAHIPVLQNPVVSLRFIRAIAYQQHGMVECDGAAFCAGVNAVTVEL